MDDAVTSFIKRTQGSSLIVTGWVVVASTAEGAIKGEPLGFTMLGSAGLAEHVKLGLLMSAANLIEGEQLRERLGLPKPPRYRPSSLYSRKSLSLAVRMKSTTRRST